MENQEAVANLENKLTEIQSKKGSCLRGQRYEEYCKLRHEENKVFAELEQLTSAEYLKSKWKVVNDKKGHYTTCKSQR